MTAARPSVALVSGYARTAVRDEATHPYHSRYDSQAVWHDVLNHFAGLTNSDEDFDLIRDAVSKAEKDLLCPNCQEALGVRLIDGTAGECETCQPEAIT